MKAGIAVAAVALLGGCSFVVRPTRDRTAPILDTVVATAAGIGCLLAVGQGDGGRGIYPSMIVCVPLAPIAIVDGISARYGFHRISGHAR